MDQSVERTMSLVGDRRSLPPPDSLMVLVILTKVEWPTWQQVRVPHVPPLPLPHVCTAGKPSAGRLEAL